MHNTFKYWCNYAFSFKQCDKGVRYVKSTQGNLRKGAVAEILTGIGAIFKRYSLVTGRLPNFPVEHFLALGQKEAIRRKIAMSLLLMAIFVPKIVHMAVHLLNPSKKCGTTSEISISYTIDSAFKLKIVDVITKAFDL